MVERERMESMTRASLNGYAVTARIEYGHGRSPSRGQATWACSLRETATPVPALL